MPVRLFWSLRLATLGLLTGAHVLPFQCMISEWEGQSAPPPTHGPTPTAHALVTDVAATPKSSSRFDPGPGTVALAQDLPFHDDPFPWRPRVPSASAILLCPVAIPEEVV